ncbi:glycoside hydrolase family 1 protein [Spiroplasma chrysopicola]|uniref:Aryl-phospho-beta-d-glucosidase n=1 Tax=Spiroplasma chrysopicola DF-1 TaxID=1276227 RepID=R4UEY6_9MOLU|nr:glycoside hydrolase family 1 protein [Spiroplasma chrysopicola]AGM24665.1 aryl-phospho-beta-d-glucosidase [Spiroplasma chrysopicola DF-1]
MKLDKDFIFGASTNAFQIEGARNLGGRTDSIWDEFTKRCFHIPPAGKNDREINSIAISADFYHKYQTDIRIMKRLGLNGLVYNIDWTRIFSKNSQEVNWEGIKFYDNVFATLRANNIKPIPILFHWDTPMWAELQGGFENRAILEWFQGYVATVFKYLGKYTDVWFVNDENSTFTLDGYLSDYLPPGKNSKEGFARAIHHLNLCTALTKIEFEKAKVAGNVSAQALLGIDHDWSPGIPYRIEDEKACQEYNLWFKNFFLDPNLKGTYPPVFQQWLAMQGLSDIIQSGDMELLKNNCVDLIGWNYYRPAYISRDDYQEKQGEMQITSKTFFVKGFKQVFPKENVRYTSWNWIIDPTMLGPGAQALWAEYQKPLMIVENGLGAFDDKSGELILDYNRAEYLSLHFAEVKKAIAQGVKFIGYSLWTYCDIFSPSGGYRKDYGLVAVDFNSPNKTRMPKLSYVWYQRLINSGGENLAHDDHDTLQQLLKDELSTWDFWYQ